MNDASRRDKQRQSECKHGPSIYRRGIKYKALVGSFVNTIEYVRASCRNDFWPEERTESLQFSLVNLSTREEERCNLGKNAEYPQSPESCLKMVYPAIRSYLMSMKKKMFLSFLPSAALPVIHQKCWWNKSISKCIQEMNRVK